MRAQQARDTECHTVIQDVVPNFALVMQPAVYLVRVDLPNIARRVHHQHHHGMLGMLGMLGILNLVDIPPISNI